LAARFPTDATCGLLDGFVRDQIWRRPGEGIESSDLEQAIRVGRDRACREGQNRAEPSISVVSVAGGFNHSLAVDGAGRIWAWGFGENGQLGNGDYGSQISPLPVAAPEGLAFKLVAAGGNHSWAIDEDGNAWAWGHRTTTPVLANAPVGVSFASVAVGRAHILALDRDGRAWMWDFTTARGPGVLSVDAVIVPPPTGVVFTDVAAGEFHSLAIDQDGRAWAWGSNSHGQLGNGSTTSHRTPHPVSMPDGVRFVQVAGGFSYSYAVDDRGLFWVWGNKSDRRRASVPEQLSTDSSVRFAAVAAGGEHALAVDRDGRLWAWLGRDHNVAPTPVDTPSGVSFHQISAGRAHLLAVDADGFAWAWGLNFQGQLGDGSVTNRAVPILVAFP
jgi:alpha-tubulin suppressor-like RCC1 family protein